MKISKEKLRVIINESIQKNLEINEMFGFQFGQFDPASFSRSGGPEFEAEEKYLVKAKEAYDDLQQYDDIVTSASSLHGIDKNLLVGILIDEYMRMYPRGFFDVLGYFGLTDTSVGISQMKGSRAKQITKDDYYTPAGYTKEQIINMSIGSLQRLIANNPDIAINYAAAYIKYIQENWKLNDQNKFLTNLEKNTKIATLYSHPNVDNYQGRTPNEETGYEGVNVPGSSRRGNRAATVVGAIKGDNDLMTERLKKNSRNN